MIVSTACKNGVIVDEKLCVGNQFAKLFEHPGDEVGVIELL